MFISGPRTSTLGSETGTTSCMLLAGQGGDHLTSSMIYHSSTVTCIPNTLVGSTVNVGTITSVCGVISGTPANSSSLLLENFNGDQTATTLRLKSGRSDVFYHMQAFSGNTTEVFRIESSGRVVSAAGACFAGNICAPAFVGGTVSGTTGIFSSTIQNVSALYVRASGNSDLPFINFSNADGSFNWGRVGGLLQGDGDGALYFQTKLGGGLTEKMRITSGGTLRLNTQATYSSLTYEQTIQYATSPAGIWLGNSFNSNNNVGLQLRTSNDGTGVQALTITPTGNVGINTTTIDQRFVINQGTANAFNQGIPATSGTTQNGILRLRPAVGFFGETLDFGMNVGPTYAWIQSTNASGLNTNYSLALNPNGGNVGIGTTSPTGLLEIYRSTSGGLGGYIILNNNGAAVANETAVIFQDGGSEGIRAAISSTTENAPYFGDIKFKTGLGTYSCLNTRMTISGEGKVGIGFTPSYKLQVAGEITSHAGTNTQFYAYMNYLGTTYNLGPGETSDNIDFKICGGATFATGGNFRWFTQAGGGTPVERLKITKDGNLAFNTAGSGAAYIQVNQATSQDGGILWYRSNVIKWQNAITTSGDNINWYSYAIGNPAFAINTNGSATLYGALTQNASDRRLKNNIVNIPNALDKIKTLNGVTFNWENNIFKTERTNDIGIIAQEIQNILPEAVTLAPFDNDGEGNSKSGENYLTVYYEKLIPLLIEGVKEQQCTINTLKTCLGIA
jgi:hypothetical protein